MKVQEALKSAIEALEANPVIDKYGALKLPALALCKAALAELEKCEPVAYMNPNAKDTLSMLHWAKSEYYSQPLYAFQTISNVEPIVWMTNREDVIEQFGTMTITNAHKNSLVLAAQIIADLFDIPLYTSPKESIKMTINEAFEKWKTESKLKVRQPLIYETSMVSESFNAGWQASAQHYECEIAELKAQGQVDEFEIQALRQDRGNLEYKCMSRLHEIEALEAQIAELSATPVESLQAHDDELIEITMKPTWYGALKGQP